MSILKQSTAATIKLGPFVDDTDGKTAETSLTISQADIRLSKNGGDFAQTNNAAGATHDELGYYDVPLDTTDTDTLGRLRVAVSKAGALPVWQDFVVVTANVYDTLCSTDKLDVNVAEMASGIITATVIATDAIDADALKADAVTKIQSGLALETTLTAVKSKTDLITTGTVITVTSPVSGSTITAIRGDTLVAVLEGIGSLTGYSNLWFTVKDYHTDPDTASIIQIEKTAGLLYINGAAASDPENGSLVVTDEASGDVTINLAAVETAQLSPRSYYYDIQILLDTGVINTLIIGIFDVLPDYTRSIGEQSL